MTQCAVSAGWFGIYRKQLIRTVGRTCGTRVDEFVGADQVGVGGNVHAGLALLQGPSRFGPMDLSKVSTAGSPLGVVSSFDITRNGNTRQQSNDRNDNHDLNQGEPIYVWGELFHKGRI